MKTLRYIIQSMRPQQFVKNGVLFLPLLGAAEFGVAAWLNTIIAAVGFYFLSAGIYILNDLYDAECDALHPRKSLRPIASGNLSPLLAGKVATFSAVIGVLLSAWAGALFPAAFYLLLMLGYNVGYKHKPVLELFLLASVYWLRLWAGELASGVPVTAWLHVLVSLGALFLVVGKRAAEYSSPYPRRVILSYSLDFLNAALSLVGGCTVVAYLLYAVMTHGGYLLATATFLVAGVLYYLYRIMAQFDTYAPDEMLLHNHVLQAIAVGFAITWCVVFYL